MDFAAASCGQFSCSAIEACEDPAAQAAPVESNDPVGKIAAFVEQSQSRLNRQTIDLHGRGGNKPPNGVGNISGLTPVPAGQHPDEFAQNGQCQHDDFGIPQQLQGPPCLVRIVRDAALTRMLVSGVILIGCRPSLAP